MQVYFQCSNFVHRTMPTVIRIQSDQYAQNATETVTHYTENQHTNKYQCLLLHVSM